MRKLKTITATIVVSILASSCNSFSEEIGLIKPKSTQVIESEIPNITPDPFSESMSHFRITYIGITDNQKVLCVTYDTRTLDCDWDNKLPMTSKGE